MKKFSSYRIRKLIVCILFSGLPFILTATQSLICRQNLFLGVPHNSDEFCYWRVLYSFSKCGFDFGSTCGYLNSEATIGPLGEHGLATLFAWGGSLLFGSVTENTLFLWNLAVLSIALLIFWIVIKPNINIALWVIALLIGNGVLLEQWYSHMMEIPCLAIIIVSITIQLSFEKRREPWLFVLGVICVTYASFMRICYIILLFPMLVAIWPTEKGKRLKWQISSFLIYILWFCSIRKISNLFMKQSESFLTNINHSENTFEKIALLLNNLILNLKNYFSLHSGTHIEIGQRYFQVCLFIILLISAFIKVENHKFSISIQRKYLSQAISLAGLIFMILLLYDVYSWRDVRTTMPYTTGVTIWYIVNNILEKNSKYLRVSLWCCYLITLFIFAPPRYCVNHPEDRFTRVKVDDKWIADLPNEKCILCLYNNNNLNSKNQFLLYQKLPPKMGVLIGRTTDKLESVNNIDYILTTEELVMENYKLWYTSEDYGLIYRRIHQ